MKKIALLVFLGLIIVEGACSKYGNMLTFEKEKDFCARTISEKIVAAIVQEKSVRLLRYVLDEYEIADINQVDWGGRPFILIAARETKRSPSGMFNLLYPNMVPFVREFLNRKANINIQDKESGNTALHYACGNFNIELVLLLLAYDANKNIKNKKKENPLDVALRKLREDCFVAVEKFEYAKIIKILIENGAKRSRKFNKGLGSAIEHFEIEIEELHESFSDISGKVRKKYVDERWEWIEDMDSLYAAERILRSIVNFEEKA